MQKFQTFWASQMSKLIGLIEVIPIDQTNELRHLRRPESLKLLHKGLLQQILYDCVLQAGLPASRLNLYPHRQRSKVLSLKNELLVAVVLRSILGDCEFHVDVLAKVSQDRSQGDNGCVRLSSFQVEEKEVHISHRELTLPCGFQMRVRYNRKSF